ncbi:uncharacterized protein LOC135618299 [Musa acuminata AAA Group]|uniref:uncharacterized protein LOC135607064 n=1 Tax=Musa acuminata AAA Group TaxID=214697 RepID=UPI0031E45B30
MTTLIGAVVDMKIFAEHLLLHLEDNNCTSIFVCIVNNLNNYCLKCSPFSYSSVKMTSIDIVADIILVCLLICEDFEKGAYFKFSAMKVQVKLLNKWHIMPSSLVNSLALTADMVKSEENLPKF